VPSTAGTFSSREAARSERLYLAGVVRSLGPGICVYMMATTPADGWLAVGKYHVLVDLRVFLWVEAAKLQL